MPDDQALISGAILLPFGFLTDVSAGALAAGTGGLKGLAAPAGGPANGSGASAGFEAELTELMQTLSGAETVDPPGGDEAAGLFSIPSDIVASPMASGLVLAGNGEAQVAEPAEGIEPQPGIPGGQGSAPEGVPLPVAPTASQPKAANDPLAGGSVPASGTADVNSPDVPIASVSSGTVPGAGIQQSNQAKGPVEVTSSQPVPAKGGNPDTTALQPRAATGVVQPIAADAPKALSPDVVPTPEVSPSADAAGVEEQPVAKAPFQNEAGVESEVRTGRRWQNELPEALRAPVQNVSRQVLPSPDPVALSVKGAPEGAGVLPAGPQVDASLSVPQAAPQANEQGVAAPKPVAASVPPQGDLVSGRGPASAPVGAEPEVAEAAAKTVPGTVVVRAAAQSSNSLPLEGGSSPLAPEAVVSSEGDAFSPEPLTQSTKDLAVKTSPSAGAGEKTSDSAPGTKQLDAAARVGAAAAPEIRPAAGVEPAPAANAFLAAQISAEELALIQQPLDGGASGEFAATIRGGEISGAMRTESLQVPGQAQSGQVSMQVAAEIVRNLKNGQTRFQMRFDPPELGRVDVNMRVGADGGVHAHLIVERPETLDMFLRDQRGLERALEAAGLSADSENLQFSLKQDGGREFASGDGQSEQSADAGQPQDGEEPDESVADLENTVQMTLAGRAGGLDLKI
ncbi:flagellar hook-length control protein FliK [Roseibium sp. HPY-6]|uniref:flagellar hook-length control protein FliK n=1 Tax=Roseibium sp. HPY-6 TaxID=3229852 RepID=UPI00338FBA73